MSELIPKWQWIRLGVVEAFITMKSMAKHLTPADSVSTR